MNENKLFDSSIDEMINQNKTIIMITIKKKNQHHNIKKKRKSIKVWDGPELYIPS